jgi:hypothetical protein
VNYIPAQGDPGSPVRHVQENPAMYLNALSLCLDAIEFVNQKCNLYGPADAARERMDNAIDAASHLRTGNMLRASVALLGGTQ